MTTKRNSVRTSQGLACGLVYVIAVGSAIALAACSTSTGDDVSNGTPNLNGAPSGGACENGSDCQSGSCVTRTCAAATSPTANDGQKDGSETDVDCGGATAPKCADGRTCSAGSDCESGSCRGGTCQAPAPDDGAKNGDETDVDCGGTKAPKCAVGKACNAHADCASDACAYNKVCASGKSCTGHFGGDTCGAGETGAADAQHESCCTTVDVTDRPAGSFRIDKYYVTAGRMRAFVDRYNGNLQGWAATAPSGWNSDWTQKLPASADDALFALGPRNKRGCDVVNQGGRTYWQPPVDGNPDEISDFSQDVLDEKALNCVTWYMAEAFCMWEGGRLANLGEVDWVFSNGPSGAVNKLGATVMPWSFHDSTAYNPKAPDDRLIHWRNYETPNPPANLRTVNGAQGPYALDHAFFIAPPGRRPKGADKYGVMDAAGLMLPWIDEGYDQFAWTESWEEHPATLRADHWDQIGREAPDGYYAIGVRCARPL